MKISDYMTRNVRLANPDESLQTAASLMAELDAGVLPVGENDRLVGMITDRDIAVRAVAAGRGPETKIRDAMTPGVSYCFEDEELDQVLHNMGQQKVRRLPVLNREKRLVGIVSVGDIVLAAHPDTTGRALGRMSEPGGQHSQSAP